MVTRVRIEAEGSTPDEVMQVLQTAHERLIVGGDERILEILFGPQLPGTGARAGLADAQAGECVIERYARDASETPDQAGHGAIVYKGRMTSHYAKPQKLMKLTGHSSLPMGPYAEVSAAEAALRVAQGETKYEVTSEGTVDRVPPLNTSTDAPLTRERLVETWNQATAAHPHERAHTRLRLFAVPGDTFVRALQLWQTDDQLQVLYDEPVQHPNLSPNSWLVSPQAGAGG